MANIAVRDSSFEAAIENAVRQLVSVRHWGSAAYINLPIYYPSGTAVAVKVEPSRSGFRVSDGSLAYREIEQIGGERGFANNARILASEIGAITDKRSIYLDCDPEGLAGAIADIAEASARIAHKIAARVVGKGDAEIADHLYERLKLVFGTMRVERCVKIQGPSTKEWEVDALVNLDGQTAVFQAVPNHHVKVYSTAAMFHDLAVKERPPVTISVVHDKTEMGAYFGILSQAGNVIEEGQSDNAYEKAASWNAI